MELVLSPSYASAANSSLTGSTASASASASATGEIEGGAVPASSSSNNNDDNLSFRASPVGSSIPHLLSTDCDNDSDDDDGDDEEAYLIHHHIIGGGYEEGFIATSTRSNSFRYTHQIGGSNGRSNADNCKFQSMLLEQQRRADEPCPDDSVVYHPHGDDSASHCSHCSHYTYPTQTVSLPPPSCLSPPLEDDVESSISLLHTNEERSHYNHHHHHQHRDPWTSTGKNLLSKFSRSAAKSSNNSRHPQKAIQPIMMMIDLDDNDEDLPWMLSQPGFGKVDAAMNRGGSVHDSGSGEEDCQSSPFQDDGGPHSLTQQQQRHRQTTTKVPTHRRYPSSLSSTSSQNSFRSILRNGTSSGSVDSSSRKTATTAADACSTESNHTPLLPRSSNWYASFIPDDSSICLELRTVQSKEIPESMLGSSSGRGCSAQVEDHDTRRSRRSISHSARKSRRDRDGVGALSVASTSTGDDGNLHQHQHRHRHRRTVSFPAELIAKDNTSISAPRHPKSPRSLPPPGSQFDPNLTPLLDMGSSRTRKKLPAHMKGTSEISPRTADFLAHEPVAVTALCKVQDRERYGHLLGPHPNSSGGISTAAAAAAGLPSSAYLGRNTYPPPAGSSQSPTKRLQASYQRRLQSEAANLTSSVRTDPNAALPTDQGIDIGNEMSPASKMHVFSFSNADRKSKLSSAKVMRRRKRLPNVDLLSPVEEIGGSIAGSAATLLPTPKTVDDNQRPFVYSLPARRSNISSQPSFASDGSCEIRDRSTSGAVSPLTSELQKAANAVWRDAETSPSSATDSSKTSFSVVATQCQCVIS